MIGSEQLRACFTEMARREDIWISRALVERILGEVFRQDALRSLLQARPALRLEMAIYRHQTGAISLGKAANLAGVSFEQMREILLSRGIELHLGPETQEEAQAEVAALRSHLDVARR